ncbi:MAG: hypothetical protein EZS28_049347, partial [Streblomastix strix]
IALILMPQWCEEKYGALFPTVTNEMNLGPCDQVLEMGKSLKRLELKLPPGNLIAVQLTNMQQSVIVCLNWKTWRKRRTGLTFMAEQMKQNNITIDMLPTERPDVHVVNALCWFNELVGKQKKSKLLLLKTHVSAKFAQFSKMSNITDSPLIKSFTRCFNLNTSSEARYDVIQDIEILYKSIRSTIFSSQQDKLLLAMTLMVCYSAARMMELQRITMDDMTMDKDIYTISTVIKRSNMVRNEKITLLQRNRQLCQVLAQKNWIKQHQSWRSKVIPYFGTLINRFRYLPIIAVECFQVYLETLILNLPNNCPSI